MNNIHFPKLGFRAIKSGISVFLCLLILPNPSFFACIAAFICLQDTISNSVKMGINRIIGTLLGGFIGLIFIYICRFVESIIPLSFLTKLFVYLVIGIGIIVVIYTCNVIKRPAASSIACIVFTGITITHAHGNPLSYAVNRTLETIVGIIISILVNKYINPPSK